MKKTVFISYHFKDATFKGEIKKWLEEAGANVISTDQSDLRPEGKEKVRAKISEQIGQSQLLLVLVGDDSHNRPWLDYEIDVAQSKQKKIRWVRLANRTGAPPEEVRKIAEVAYNPSAITQLLK